MAAELDVAGFKLRTVLPKSYVSEVESLTPGFTAAQIRLTTARIYAQLRKRYARSIPFGQVQPPLESQGTVPPLVVISGNPTSGSNEIRIQIVGSGALGTATYQWSFDGGSTWQGAASPILTSLGPTLLGLTGISVSFPAGNYSADNLYFAAAATPSCFLDWLVNIVSFAVLRKRGFNPTDPAASIVATERDRCLKEIEQASGAKDNSFDLPAADDLEPSAVKNGGNIFYTESSPYAGADATEFYGRQEDFFGRGTVTDSDFGSRGRR